MKRGIIISLLFIFLFSCNVYASEEDILKEPIKDEEEHIKEEKIDKKENIEENIVYEFVDKRIIDLGIKPKMTKSNVTTNDAMQALFMTLEFPVSGTNNSYWSGVIYIADINIGTNYKVSVPDKGYIYPIDGYLKRGYEVPTGTPNNNSGRPCIAYLWTEYTGSAYPPSDRVEFIFEPTPEPTLTPEPEEPEVNPDTISCNEILREILKTNRGIAQDVKNIYRIISYNNVSDSVLSDNTISDNIISKRLEDYSTSEALALIGLVLAFGALIVYIIHKSVFKIRR